MSHTKIIEIEIECSEEQLPAALLQAALLVTSAQMPNIIRQLEDFRVPAAMQLPNFTFQSTPLLENKNERQK